MTFILLPPELSFTVIMRVSSILLLLFLTHTIHSSDCEGITTFDGNCVPISNKCPPGQVKRGPNCIEAPICEEGSVWNDMNCIKQLPCPHGYHMSKGICTDSQGCPIDRPWNGVKCT